MANKLLSYEECRKICDFHGNFIFYESKHNIDGYDISIFNYRLAMPVNFEFPITGREDLKAHEMRGLVFVFNKDGSIYKRYLLLDKFWNLNQSECSMYSVVKDLKIKAIHNKEDGSIASFIKLPNGKVVARSKASFISTQAEAIQKIYNNWSAVKNFVDMCLDRDLVPIFEYVSPFNRIVLSYPKIDLILLRIRDNKTGKYLDLKDFDLTGITVAPVYNNSLDELIELKETLENKEGWIVQFDNDQMVKIKTKWYCDLHKLFTEDINMEHTLVSLILNETIDDVVAQLPEEDLVTRSNIEAVTSVLNEEIHNIDTEVETMCLDYKGNKKDFALKWCKHKYFDICVSILFRGEDKMTKIKDWIKKACFKKEMAKSYLASIGYTAEDINETVLTVSVSDKGTRLDKFISTKLLSIPRTKIQTAIDSRLIKVNQSEADKSYKLKSGDIVTIILPKS